MGGTMEQKERIKAAYLITTNAIEIDPEEIRKIEAVIYAMADKFLESMDLEEIMEEMSMTRMGQKLVKEGSNRAKLEDAKNLVDLLDEHIIAERIGLPLETVHKLKEEYQSTKKG